MTIIIFKNGEELLKWSEEMYMGGYYIFHEYGNVYQIINGKTFKSNIVKLVSGN